MKRPVRMTVQVMPRHDDLALWRCAAALEPHAPTGAGVSIAEILKSGDTTSGAYRIPVADSFNREFRTKRDRELLPEVMALFVTNHARAVLERNGLVIVPRNWTINPDDVIPF